MNLMRLTTTVTVLALLAGCVKWVHEYRDERSFSHNGKDYTIARMYARPKGNVDEDDWDFANYVVKINGGWVDCGSTAESCRNTIDSVMNASQDDGDGSDGGGSDDSGGDSGGGGDTDGPT